LMAAISTRYLYLSLIAQQPLKNLRGFRSIVVIV